MTKDRQRQSLLDKIGKQQQELQEQAICVQELHSQAQAHMLSQQQQADQLNSEKVLAAQLKSETVHLKNKLAAQQTASDAQQQSEASLVSQIASLQSNVALLKTSQKTAAARHEAMTGLKQEGEKQLVAAQLLLEEKDAVVSSILAQLNAASASFMAKEAAVLSLEQQVHAQMQL